MITSKPKPNYPFAYTIVFNTNDERLNYWSYLRDSMNDTQEKAKLKRSTRQISFPEHIANGLRWDFFTAEELDYLFANYPVLEENCYERWYDTLTIGEKKRLDKSFVEADMLNKNCNPSGRKLEVRTEKNTTTGFLHMVQLYTMHRIRFDAERVGDKVQISNIEFCTHSGCYDKTKAGKEKDMGLTEQQLKDILKKNGFLTKD